MVSFATLYTPEYFYQKKKEYDSLGVKSQSRTDMLRKLVKKNVVSSALYLAETQKHVGAIYWLCEKYVEGDIDIKLSPKEFREYMQHNIMFSKHIPSMHLFSQFCLDEEARRSGKFDEWDGESEYFSLTNSNVFEDAQKYEDKDTPTQEKTSCGFLNNITEKVKKAKESDPPLEKSIERVPDKKITNNENEDRFKKLARKVITIETVDKALEEFDDLIGLNTVKEKIRQFSYVLVAESKRRKHGIKLNHSSSYHMVFTGNPGTGKTVVARKLGKLFKSLGVVSKGHVVEVDRADLVGAYIGHTEYYTKQVLKKARGGVLFIDEAYGLNKGFSWDFGAEAVELIMKAMEDERDDLVIVFAGYPQEMQWFTEMNPGLRSRIATILNFPDYSVDELAAIFENYAIESGFKVDSYAIEKLNYHLKTVLSNEKNKFGNARGIRNMFEQVLRNQALRVVERNIDDEDALITISAQDICDGNGKLSSNATAQIISMGK